LNSNNDDAVVLHDTVYGVVSSLNLSIATFMAVTKMKYL